MSPLPIITEHAILRYQERVEQVPEGEVKCALDTDGLRKAIAAGCGCHELDSGHKAILAGRRIVTILEPGMRPKKTRARRARRRVAA